MPMHVLLKGPQACGKTTLAREMKGFLERSGRTVLIVEGGERWKHKNRLGKLRASGDREVDVLIETALEDIPPFD